MQHAHRRIIRTAAAALVGGGSILAAPALASAQGLEPVDPSQAPTPPPPGNGDSPASVNGLIEHAEGTAATGCPGGYTCAWTNPNFEGRRLQVRQANSNWGAFPNSTCPTGTWKDCASSAHNRRGEDLTAYFKTDVNYGGELGILRPGAKDPSLSAPFNDNIASNFF